MGFRGGREITSNTHKTKRKKKSRKMNDKKKKEKKMNELQLIGETYFLYYDRRFNKVVFIYQNIEGQPANFLFEFFLR